MDPSFFERNYQITLLKASIGFQPTRISNNINVKKKNKNKNL